MLREVEYINKALKEPSAPLQPLSEARVSGKLEVLENLVDKVDKVIIGGGMAFTFIKALGRAKSLVEDDLVDTAGPLWKSPCQRVKFYLC